MDLSYIFFGGLFLFIIWAVRFLYRKGQEADARAAALMRRRQQLARRSPQVAPGIYDNPSGTCSYCGAYIDNCMIPFHNSQPGSRSADESIQ